MNLELEQRVQQRTQDLEVLNQRLQQLSDTDQLTQLKNRRALESQLAQEWARAVRYGHSLAVVLVDIDHFKSINDRHGHPAGDSCLQQVAALIAASVRWPGDTTSRYGGEEFCLLLPEVYADEALRIIEAMRERIAGTQINTMAATFNVTISAGMFVAVPRPDLTTDTFIREADAALYESKQNGRNRVTMRSVPG
jgi:diguanylate cyclase